MSDFAVVSFNGRLGPMKFFEVGKKKTPKASFSVAINRSRRVIDGRGDDGGDWVKTVAWLPCIAWGVKAQQLKERGAKGMPIAGYGDWVTESYENKEGKNVSFSSVVLTAMALPDNNVRSGSAEPKQQPAPSPAKPVSDDSDDDEIPF